MGCPCHLVHNIAGHASEAFRNRGFYLEDLCVNVYYYWLNGSLKEFCAFCDNEVVRYVSVRWLSLEKAVHRILQSLQRSEESQARFQ